MKREKSGDTALPVMLTVFRLERGRFRDRPDAT